MAKLELIIKGISLSYLKDGLWTVLLPFDDCHTVDFFDGENLVQPLKAANQRIRIRTEGNVKSESKKGENFSNFMDVSQPATHSTGLAMKEGWEEKTCLLTLENATLSEKEPCNSKVKFQEVATDDFVKIPTESYEHKAYSGVFEIEAEKIIFEADEVLEKTIVLEDDANHEFEIVNTCTDTNARVKKHQNGKDASDFQLLYENTIVDAEKRVMISVAGKKAKKSVGRTSETQSDDGAIVTQSGDGDKDKLVSAGKKLEIDKLKEDLPNIFPGGVDKDTNTLSSDPKAPCNKLVATQNLDALAVDPTM